MAWIHSQHVSSRPFENLIKVPALMPCVEIWIRPRVVLEPTMADHTNTGIAHQELSQHFNAVTYHIGEHHYM